MAQRRRKVSDKEARDIARETVGKNPYGKKPPFILRGPKGRSQQEQVSKLASGLYKYYKTGEQPRKVVDTKTVSTRKEKPRGKGSVERERIASGVRGGTVGGMSRKPGSKPPARPTLAGAKALGKERNRRAAEKQAIIKKIETTPSGWSFSPKSREEQKGIEARKQKALDRAATKAARTATKVMQRDVKQGQVNPLAEKTVMGEAHRRVNEAIKEIARKEKLAQDAKKAREKARRIEANKARTTSVTRSISKGAKAGGVLGSLLGANLAYKQEVKRISEMKKKQNRTF